ncbi:MAG: tol-pal system protein YbgF [Xanthomonadaceae bacterium]|nr:tol-pal system protein YbgF [Xanthomonadaceae bacterium]MDP2184130.1 tol-pal system protein YbgF [Xanthomonadales bacterium]MDZ4116840.1 tol-pal system protein YbgF [Xanthomonadaceae bacterium]MDZ4378987.1 tol-pal system protein YbgF [Xanthomonadaceae bacterium]
MATASVFAQARPSLADRVARLEQQQIQAQANNQNVELLNRITDLQTEIQSLRAQLEKQQFELEQLKQRNRQQYIDLDGRLGRIESGSYASSSDAVAAPTPVAPADATQDVSAPSSAAQSTIDEPDATAVVAEPGTQASSDAAATPVLDERAAYEQAFDSLKNGEYAEAARRFKAFLVAYPDGSYAPNAYYWLGESYYVTQNFELAQTSFQALLERFPESAKAPDALLKLGYCQYELKQFNASRATLGQVIERYPDSTVARLAQGRLRAMMLEDRQ